MLSAYPVLLDFGSLLPAFGNTERVLSLSEAQSRRTILRQREVGRHINSNAWTSCFGRIEVGKLESAK
jgi:hypothetical protein